MNRTDDWHKVHKKSRLLPIVLITCIVAAAAGLFLYGLRLGLNQSAAGSASNPVADPRSYVGQVVAMQNIQPVIEDGKIKVKLAEVIQAGIVGFTTENDRGDAVPMMVYITPSGRLNAGTAQCACGNSSFSLAGRAVVCDACRSTYDIEYLTYLSGAAICEKYPPTAMMPVVEDGIVEIEQQDVLRWRNQARENAGGVS